MKKPKSYRLSEQALSSLSSLSFLLGKEYGKDATHVIESALAQAEALWHMRDKLNAEQNALQHVEMSVTEHKAKTPLLRPNGKL